MKFKSLLKDLYLRLHTDKKIQKSGIVKLFSPSLLLIESLQNHFVFYFCKLNFDEMSPVMKRLHCLYCTQWHLISSPQWTLDSFQQICPKTNLLRRRNILCCRLSRMSRRLSKTGIETRRLAQQVLGFVTVILKRKLKNQFSDILQLSIKSPSVSPPIPSFSGIRKVMKFY